MILVDKSLLFSTPHPAEAQVRKALRGVLVDAQIMRDMLMQSLKHPGLSGNKCRGHYVPNTN
jgi:hypothetical protein